MFRAVKAHPGVFVGGMITYAVVAHWLLPTYRNRMVKSG